MPCKVYKLWVGLKPAPTAVHTKNIEFLKSVNAKTKIFLAASGGKTLFACPASLRFADRRRENLQERKNADRINLRPNQN
jgi:hypothetical protein